MKIKEIKNSKKNFFDVTFESGESIVLSAESVVKFSLKENPSISEEKYREIIDYDNSLKALDFSLSLLSKKPIGAQELGNKLAAKEYDAKTIDAAVGRMKDLGYIDDKKYGEDLADYLLAQDKGLNFIVNEMERRGINKETVNEIAAKIKEKANSSARLDEITARKFKAADFKDEKTKAKIASYFERQGFDFDDIEKALNRAEQK
ncbi:MAG: recombination regulator RecX [Elusimicrobiota bacterium]|jgi:regulatory protein|nr:recombination regulator RecX [Elusimicrobiota bacterium]